MNVGGTKRSDQGLSVLFVDSDPDYLAQSCSAIAEDGHRAWGAEDLLAAANFLAGQVPDLIVVEIPLLEMDGADPLGDLKARAPSALVILAASGPPDDQFRVFGKLHEVYGYHDKHHGIEGLRLSVNAALGTVRQLSAIRNTRQAIQEVLAAVPELHRIQSLDELLETILEKVAGLLGSDGAFVAARMSDPVGKPPLEGFADSVQTIDDYVIGATSEESFPRGETVDKLKSVPKQLVTRAVEEGSNIIDDRHGVLTLALAEHVLGLAYLNRPDSRQHDSDLLEVFSTQAAAAIRNAALYELATVDATTRVFQKSFTLDRLRETIKLGWRKAFPVSVLMLDIDQFKNLNDEHGHIVGDRALRHIGTLLKDNVRDSDIVGRFGGDEFLVILIDANRVGADIVADRLHQSLVGGPGRPWPDGVPPLKTSMGLATLDPGEAAPQDFGFPDFPAVVERIVGEADAAMYRARREARGMFAAHTLTWADFAKG